jgi:hypothetical protein
MVLAENVALLRGRSGVIEAIQSFTGFLGVRASAFTAEGDYIRGNCDGIAIFCPIM